MSSLRSMAGNASDFAQLLREFLTAHAALSGLFSRLPGERIRYGEWRALVDDDETSVLFRLKERSHRLFRPGRGGSEIDAALMRPEALFDLLVGSLFHEAMQLRESLYQQEVYVPRLARLHALADGGEDEPLIEAFERVLEREAERLEAAIAEVRILLAQTRDQFQRVLMARAREGSVTRCLLSRREQVDATFPGGLTGLLEAMHGDLASGLVVGARSLIESAYYREGSEALREAGKARGAPRAVIESLLRYAAGMQAFLEGDYLDSIQNLETWVDLSGHEAEPELAVRAAATLGRLDRLVGEGREDAAALDAAKQLQLRLEPRMESGAG